MDPTTRLVVTLLHILILLCYSCLAGIIKGTYNIRKEYIYSCPNVLWIVVILDYWLIQINCIYKAHSVVAGYSPALGQEGCPRNCLPTLT